MVRKSKIPEGKGSAVRIEDPKERAQLLEF